VLGIISPTLFTVRVIMAVVTTFAATPVLLRLRYPPSSGRAQVPPT
jgi:hypothetical protein